MPVPPTVKDPTSDKGTTPKNPPQQCGFIEDIDAHGKMFLLPYSGPTLPVDTTVEYEVRDMYLATSKTPIKIAFASAKSS